jgi:hypothetical protein
MVIGEVYDDLLAQYQGPPYQMSEDQARDQVLAEIASRVPGMQPQDIETPQRFVGAVGRLGLDFDQALRLVPQGAAFQPRPELEPEPGPDELPQQAPPAQAAAADAPPLDPAAAAQGVAAAAAPQNVANVQAAAQAPVVALRDFYAQLPQGNRWRQIIQRSKTLRELVQSGLLTAADLVAREHATGFVGYLVDGTAVPGQGGPGGGVKYLAELETLADVTPEPEVSSRQYNPRRFRTVDVADLFEDLRRVPAPPTLAPGRTVYRRPQMAEEGVPLNAETV